MRATCFGALLWTDASTFCRPHWSAARSQWKEHRVLEKAFIFLPNHEVTLAQEEPANLSGQIECDARSIRKWKKEDGTIQYYQVFGMFRRPTSSSDRGQFCVYSMGCASSQKSGKPPPESRKRILETRAFDQISARDSAKKQTVILTDGCPSYSRICSDYGLRHESCNHSKGVFCVKKRLRSGELLIHTGAIDGMWRLCKESVPTSLRSRDGDDINANIMKFDSGNGAGARIKTIF